MALARDEQTAASKERAPQRSRATPASDATAVQRMPGPQNRPGNGAVVEMLRRAGHPGAQEQHRHGPGCGHPAQESPVQRSPEGSTVARAEEEDGHVHGTVRDTSPEGQSALLAAAMKSPSRPLPSSVVAKAGAFYQNDRLSSTRVHHDAVAQRATSAMGAQAMTIGNHIFLSGGSADEKLIGHELSHVDKNLKGIPETGHGNGAGVTVTDPRQGSERAAERDGAAYAAGETTAPSVVAQRTAATAPQETVQRMTEEDSPSEGRRIDLQEQPPGLSAEDHIAALSEDSEEEVFLKRGITPTQAMYLQEQIIRGSFVSLSKIAKKPDENATKPDPEDVTEYVNGNRNDRAAGLVEFSTVGEIATKYASEARLGVVITIRIRRKYLAKGSTGGERGWIAKQGAPYDIVAIEQRDSTKDPEVSPMTEDEFRQAVKTEEMAEFLLSIQDSDALVNHMKQFQGMDKLNEAKKIAAYKKELFKK